ncbi:MAG: hypothetical protein LCH54_17965 [Bacteroidetes bacterium]|nr:hypothetical protein [Bacteroidota bacterium]
MKNQTLLKSLLVIQTLSVLIYTVIAFQTQGPDLVSIALANIGSLTWTGQFNLDFFCYLTLSGLWIMWRGDFNRNGILIGLAAMVLGIVFFAPYLFWLLTKENGDLKRVLIGNR